MNPITVLAFLLGINGPAPTAPAEPQLEQPSAVKETKNPAGQQGVAKGGMEGEGRGGWDRN